MDFINGINEVANPLLVFVPIIMMVLSGFTIGRFVSFVRNVKPQLIKDFVYGSILLNFVFISGFIIFGVAVYEVKAFFTVFTFVILALSVICIYLLVKPVIKNIKNIRYPVFNSTHLLTLLGISLFITLVGYYAIVIYYHSVFSEYDSIYLFLPISKSILLGNGLNHDYYTGSDIAIRFPPLPQAINAWLIYSFGYSTLRIFPLYYVILSSILVYLLARNVVNERHFGLIASILFLIMPALFVISSRFSMQQDLPFIFLLTAVFYFLTDFVQNGKSFRIQLLLIIISLSMLPLTREVGLIISVAIFFLIPAIRFTEGNLKLRAFFTFLSLVPLYLLTLYDLIQHGFENMTVVRLITLLIANVVMFYLLSLLKNQNHFRDILKCAKYLVPIIIPLIFILSNVIMFTGPYPIMTFSSKFTQSVNSYRQVFGIPTEHSFTELLQQNLPRLDILIITVATGSIFIFFKILGLARLIYCARNSVTYVMILILLIVLLVMWSFLLNSGFKAAAVRHIGYFIPLLSVIIVIGMDWTKLHYKLYYFGIIVLATYYFLFYNLHIYDYSKDIFGGFWIDPNKSSIVTLNDLRLAVVLIAGMFLVLELWKFRIWDRFKNQKLKTLSTTLIVIGLISFQFYILASSSAKFVSASLDKIDEVPPSGWEKNVFEPINYLKTAEDGNVFGVRTPAISFFTNRTNYDLYSEHVYSIFRPLLEIENSTLLKKKLSDMNIRYIVLPNERNSLFYLVNNLNKNSKLIKMINTDPSFKRVDLKSYSVYKFDPNPPTIDFAKQNYLWKSVGAGVTHDKGIIDITERTNNTQKIFSRGYLLTEINSKVKPHLLTIEYSSTSQKGMAKFLAEFRGNANKILWSHYLNDTNGRTRTQTFVLPKETAGTPVELRMYILTHGPGEHELVLKRAAISNT